jgi:hypothetical protein
LSDDILKRLRAAEGVLIDAADEMNVELHAERLKSLRLMRELAEERAHADRLAQALQSVLNAVDAALPKQQLPGRGAAVTALSAHDERRADA